LALILAAGAPAGAQPYHARVLVNNVCCGPAEFDPNLDQAWGVAIAATGPAWVSSLAKGKSTLYDGDGKPQQLVVDIPGIPQTTTHGSPTGIVAAPGEGFLVPNGAGAKTPARFLFAKTEGLIAGWTPLPHPPPQNTQAQIAVDHTRAGAVYTGLGMIIDANGVVLVGTDFRHKHVDSFDKNFQPLALPFTDPGLTEGVSPYNVKFAGDRVFVAYARPASNGIDVVTGPGLGVVDVYNTAGEFKSRLVTGGVLNAPWGMALAPDNFGRFSGALLVGNFGDGKINAFHPDTGAFLGTLTNEADVPVVIDGLRGLEFGNGTMNQPVDTLFFAAAPTFASIGEYGRIDVVGNCYANCDGSTEAPVLNINDFACFQSRFAAGDSYANCDQSTTPPVLNVNDFTCFISKFAAGCP
jgi:uncharacterized protein (TIGR03118 family)